MTRLRHNSSLVGLWQSSVGGLAVEVRRRRSSPVRHTLPVLSQDRVRGGGHLESRDLWEAKGGRCISTFSRLGSLKQTLVCASTSLSTHTESRSCYVKKKKNYPINIQSNIQFQRHKDGFYSACSRRQNRELRGHAGGFSTVLSENLVKERQKKNHTKHANRANAQEIAVVSGGPARSAQLGDLRA